MIVKCIYVFVFNALQLNHELQSIIPKSAIENHAYLYAVLKKHIPKVMKFDKPSSEPVETSGAIRNNLYLVAIKKLKKLSENIVESEYYKYG